MNAKSLLIPIAAFAVTVTGVSAFNSEVLEEAGLTDEQIAAFEEAREKRESGDREGARDVLAEAGIDVETMEAVREAMHAHKHEMHHAIHDAVENEDYAAFQAAIADSPLADVVTSEEDFALFVEAHNYKEAGDWEAAKAIFEDLGIERGFGAKGGHHGHHGFMHKGERGGEGFGHSFGAE